MSKKSAPSRDETAKSDAERAGLKDQKSYERAIEYVKNLLSTGRLAPGVKLPAERELAATLNLGRNSAREAVRMLENLGIVESRQGSGNYVVDKFGDSLTDLFEFSFLLGSIDLLSATRLKRIMEAEAISIACSSRNRADLAELKELLESFPDEIDEDAFDAWLANERAFHHKILTFSGGALFLSLNAAIDNLYSHNFCMRCVFSDPSFFLQSKIAHRDMFDAIAEGNALKGVSAVSLHYNFAESFIRNDAANKDADS